MAQSKSPLQVDTKWLRAQIERRGLSQRFVAQKLKLDPGAFSLLLRGSPTRKWHFHHVQALSDLLGVPFGQVLSHLGIDADLGTPGATVPVIGIADNQGNVTADKSSRVVAPPHQERSLRAILMTSEHAPVDIAVMYAGAARPARECVGRICYIETGTPRIRLVRRSAQENHYYLTPVLGNKAADEADVELEAAAPVTWIRV